MNETPLYSEPPPPVAPPPPPAASATEPSNPWFSMWVRPRATMRQILDSDPRRMVHVLALLAGMTGSLQAHIPVPVSGMIPLYGIFILKMVIGALGGLLFLYLFGFLLRVTGRWLDGQGDFVAVRAAIAWASIPKIWSALLFLPLIVYLGQEALNIDAVTLIWEPGGLLLMLPIGLIAIVAGVWSFVVLLKCLAEAHRFSAWHALGSFLLGLVVLIVPLAMVGFLVALVVVGTIGVALN